MSILVFGGAGYIGSVLVPYLKEKGEAVEVYDNFLYGKKYKSRDIRDIDQLEPAIDKAETIIHLAGLSNDPLADLKPSLTWETNYRANETISRLLQFSKKRIIFISSCSVYGFGKDEFTEESKLHPVTLYARTKALSEELFLNKFVDSTILRLATVYGMSPNPRLDLVVNTMIATSYFKNKITVNGGDQYRPVVHVNDVSRAVYHLLKNKNKHRVYNVGSNKQNYKIMEIGHIIFHYLMEKPKLVYNDFSIDRRSYKVSFSRLERTGFSCEYDIADAVDELYKAFEDKEIRSMDKDVYFRVKYLKKICHLK